MNIQTILQLDKGTKIPSLTATVKASFKPTTWNGADKGGNPKTLYPQNVILEDSSGEIRAGFWWNSMNEAFTGNGVPVVLSGEVDEYQGKKQLKNCKIIRPQVAQPQQPAQQQAQQQQSNGKDNGEIRRMWAAGRVVELLSAGAVNPNEASVWLCELLNFAEKGIMPKWGLNGHHTTEPQQIEEEVPF